MLKIRDDIVNKIRAAADVAVLRDALQKAVELEHATIPAYLTALYSIKQGQNVEAAQILHSVAVQEMLHLTIAANVLNAIGGAPNIDHPGFIPVFPGPLPMGVHEGLAVGLEKLTRGLVYNTFMVIEEPEVQQHFPLKAPRLHAAAPTPKPKAPASGYASIGDFYTAIIDKITELGQHIFTGDPVRQVVDDTWFPADQLFPIRTVSDAARGLGVIIEQGEGTGKSPEDPDKGIAHYYRFAEIVYGRKLVADSSEPSGYSYSGAPVTLDPAGIWDLYPNARTVDYAPGSRARHLAEQFNYSYTSLLRALHTTFNGSPDKLRSSLGLMFELKLLAGNLVSTLIPGTTLFAAPTFEYTPISV